MSWQAYVDTLIGRGKVDQAAIFSGAGDSVWAASPGLTVAPADIKAILASFNDTSDPKGITTSGFKVSNQKYMTLDSDEKLLMGRKGKEGVVCFRTKQLVLIAHHPDSISTPAARIDVEWMGDYLMKAGY